MTELWLRKIGTGLFAADAESEAAFAKLPRDKPLQCVVKLPRNPGHHRLYYKLKHRVVEYLNDDRITDDVMHELFKLSAGIYSVVELPSGDKIKVVGSIAWAKMNQAAFHDFFEAIVRFIYNELRIPPAVVADLLVPDERKP